MSYTSFSDKRGVLGGTLVQDYSFFRLPIFEHFCDRPYHTIMDLGQWAANRLLAYFEPHLIRSEQIRSSDPTDNADRMSMRLLFHPAEDVFVLLERGRLFIFGPTRAVAEELFANLARECRAPNPEKPRFALLNYSEQADVKDVELSRTSQMDAAELRLHYGDEFPAWETGFVNQLQNQPKGLFVLRGEAGTGKTFFIRHLICKLQATHRFFYLPAYCSFLLTSPDMTRFWLAQHRENPGLRQVIVLEDAEELLQVRDDNNRSYVSSLLNASDGLMSEFLNLQILATLNCPLQELDPAIKRAGRLLAYREFRRLTRLDARRLAYAKGLNLSPQEDYSLAEIYNNSVIVDERANRRLVGFAAGDSLFG